MLLSHREVRAAHLGAGLATSAIIHRSYRAHAVDNRAVVSEDALMLRAFERLGRVGRPCATLVLEGAARLSAHGRVAWLAPGEGATLDYKSAIVMRQEGARYRAVALEWDVAGEGALGARPEPFAGITDPAVFACAEALWRALRDERPAEPGAPVVDALAALLAALRAAGVALREVRREALTEPVDAQTVSLSRALDRVLSAMDDQPMVTDLADTMALSPRHLQRLVSGFHEAYGFNSASWQDTRSRRRVMMGVALMTAPGARVEQVARIVGYRSAQSFARALSLAGLPAPGAVRDEVDRCREGRLAEGT